MRENQVWRDEPVAMATTTTTVFEPLQSWFAHSCVISREAGLSGGGGEEGSAEMIVIRRL